MNARRWPWSSAREPLLLAAILAVAAFVRLYRLDMTWFYVDQVRDMSVAGDIAAGVSYPLLGPGVGGSSSHIGPLYFYLISVPFFFSKAALAGPAFVALLGVVAVLILYYFARAFVGAEVALTACALFAVFPPAVVDSRVLWNPGALPCFTILFMWALCALVVNGRSSAIVGALVLLVVLTQLHLTAVSLGAAGLAAVLVLRPRARGAHLAIGLGLALLLYAPYVIYEATHGFADFESLAAVIRLDQSHPGPRAGPTMLKSLVLLFRPMLDGFVLERAWSPTFWTVFSLLYAGESALFALGVFLSALVVIRGWRHVPREATKAVRFNVVLLLWLALPLVILGLRRIAVWWYYLDVLYPSQFIFAGIGAAALRSAFFAAPRVRPWVARGVASALVALVLTQAAFQVGLQRRIAQQGEVVLDAGKLGIGAPTSGFGVLAAVFDVPGKPAGFDARTRPVLESIPLGYRERILEALLDLFGVDRAEIGRLVHGGVLGLPEENDYLIRRLSVTPARRAKRPDRHYVIEKAAAAGGGRLPAGARIGPYAIIEFEPIVDYESWSYAQSTGDAGRGWRRAEVPWMGPGDISAAGGAVLWRGRLRAPADRRAIRLNVSAIGDRPIGRLWIEVGGQAVSPISSSFRASPWLYWRTTGTWDLTDASAIREGAIVVGLAEGGRIMSFDVWEGVPR